MQALLLCLTANLPPQHIRSAMTTLRSRATATLVRAAAICDVGKMSVACARRCAANGLLERGSNTGMRSMRAVSSRPPPPPSGDIWVPGSGGVSWGGSASWVRYQSSGGKGGDLDFESLMAAPGTPLHDDIMESASRKQTGCATDVKEQPNSQVRC